MSVLTTFSACFLFIKAKARAAPPVQVRMLTQLSVCLLFFLVAKQPLVFPRPLRKIRLLPHAPTAAQVLLTQPSVSTFVRHPLSHNPMAA